MPNFRSYGSTQFPSNRFIMQDDLVASTMINQATYSRNLQNAASAESATNARYHLALRQYYNTLTGFPEYLK
jgi:hypothetical protein